MDNNKYNTNDIKRICENKLKIVFRDGSEFNGWFWFEGRKIYRITVPKGRKDIPPKTYKSMATQLGLEVNQFDNMLECTLLLIHYEEIIRGKLHPEQP